MAQKKRTQAICSRCHMAYETREGQGYKHHARVSLIHKAALKRNPAPALYAGAGSAVTAWANPKRKKRLPPRKKNGQFRRKR